MENRSYNYFAQCEEANEQHTIAICPWTFYGRAWTHILDLYVSHLYLIPLGVSVNHGDYFNLVLVLTFYMSGLDYKNY